MGSMNKMRSIVFIFLCLLGYGNYFFLSDKFSSSWLSGMPDIVSALLFVLMNIFTLSFLLIFIFSFVQIKRNPQGVLCYDPSNYYWRTMKRLWGGAWGNKNSLCRMVRLTFFSITIAVLIILGIAGMFVGLYSTATSPTRTSFSLFSVAYGVLLWASIAGLAIVSLWFSRKIYDAVRQKGMKIVVACLLTSSYFFGISAIVAFTIGISFWVAAVGALAVLGCIIGVGIAIAGTVALLQLIVKYFPKVRDLLKNSFLGVLYDMLKKGTCPIVYECSFKPAESERE